MCASVEMQSSKLWRGLAKQTLTVRTYDGELHKLGIVLPSSSNNPLDLMIIRVGKCAANFLLAMTPVVQSKIASTGIAVGPESAVRLLRMWYDLAQSLPPEQQEVDAMLLNNTVEWIESNSRRDQIAPCLVAFVSMYACPAWGMPLDSLKNDINSELGDMYALTPAEVSQAEKSRKGRQALVNTGLHDIDWNTLTVARLMNRTQL